MAKQKATPDLKIQATEAKITDLNTRVVVRGDERSGGVDISFNATIPEDGKDTLKALHVPHLIMTLWDENGDKSETMESISVSTRRKLKNLTGILKATKGKKEIKFTGADLKNIRFVPGPNFGLQISAMLQCEIEPEAFPFVWNLQLEGDCKIDILGRQAEIELGMSD